MLAGVITLFMRLVVINLALFIPLTAPPNAISNWSHFELNITSACAFARAVIFEILRQSRAATSNRETVQFCAKLLLLLTRKSRNCADDIQFVIAVETFKNIDDLQEISSVPFALFYFFCCY